MADANRPGETKSSLAGRRVVIATYGSLGDLHPFLALGKEVLARGGLPIIATSEYHRDRVERQGLHFYPARPHFPGLEQDSELFRRAMDVRTGHKTIMRLFMDNLRDNYDDLLTATEGADLFVSHTVAFGGPLVADRTGIPWASVTLAPISMFSKHDPSVPPPAPWLRHLRPLGPRFWGAFNALARRAVGKMTLPVRTLRRELGLPPVCGEPLLEGAHAPGCVLAMFSRELGAPQPDWPVQTVQTGFAFLDDSLAEGTNPELRRFLDDGPPPLVFTLGSSAVMTAGRFYEKSLAAVKVLGRRAVLLIGTDPRNQPTEPLPSSVLALPYAPYSELFPRAAAIVHQGGVGTTGQALRSGRPMLVVPWAHDQPDNGQRIRRLGVGLTIPRARYNARTAAHALGRLLDEPSFAALAEEVGRRVARENGASVACDALERYLAVIGR